MRYIVHGATGAQGSPVLAALAEAGRATVAVTSKTVSGLAGMQTMNADYASSERLAEIYRGAAGVFVHLPVAMPAQRRIYAESISAALVAARPARIVISTSGKVIDRPGEEVQEPEEAGLPHLVRRVRDAGLSYAVVAPMNFLENLLLPPVQQGVHFEGVLRYPLRDDVPVSWTSHFDVADTVVALFERSDISGLVGVGYEPGIIGHDLAAGFAAHLGRSVVYQGLEPALFGQLLAPILGEGPSMTVASHYEAINRRAAHVIDAATSAQRILGLTPRSVARWLVEVGVGRAVAGDAEGDTC